MNSLSVKEFLKNNERTIKTLNKMILSNQYKGVIKNKHFVFKRNYFPNNFIITGTLNEENFFEIDFGYKKPLDILSKILLIFSVFICLFFIINQNLILTVLTLFFTGLKIIYFKTKGAKEFKFFLDSFIDFQKTIIHY